jgi:DNA-binding response OmpR family regulator
VGPVETDSRRLAHRAKRSQPTCLVVEDDHTMRHLAMNYLAEHDIRAISASRRDEVAGLLVREEPNLVILDLRLGQEDGLDLLREIRSRSDVPVIVTTGHRRDEIDRVVELELGADDYITKPFGLRELLALIRAVLRRREAGQAAVQRDPERGRCRFGGWQLDRRNRRLTDPNGIPVALTKGEYALLIAFLDAPQRPLSREHLLQAGTTAAPQAGDRSKCAARHLDRTRRRLRVCAARRSTLMMACRAQRQVKAGRRSRSHLRLPGLARNGPNGPV